VGTPSKRPPWLSQSRLVPSIFVQTIYSEVHHRHHARQELINGRFEPALERPERADLVLGRVEEVKLGPVRGPSQHGAEAILRVHSPRYVEFLQSAWEEWTKARGTWDALPLSWPTRGFRQIEPEHIDGRLSYFSFDAATAITAGTWEAARTAADVALTGADLIRGGEGAAFALCRPPGHHAARDLLGGYCYLNNAAIAAQSLIEAGVGRLAIVDIDYHHGNGTQSIFYERSDVLYVSLHGDPRQEYPFFCGHPDETGGGAGEGFNLNLAMPWGTGFGEWLEALTKGCRTVADFGPDVVVVSLGVDTYKACPMGHFLLDTPDYLRVGETLAGLGRPTLFVLEGGYALEAIGPNVVNVLAGFEGG